MTSHLSLLMASMERDQNLKTVAGVSSYETTSSRLELQKISHYLFPYVLIGMERIILTADRLALRVL